MPLDFKALDKGLIVSCQPVKGGAMDRAEMVVGFALAAIDGGASALRIESAAYVAAVRAATDRPIIGLVKRVRPEGDVVVVNTEASTAKTLAITGLDNVFTVVGTRDAALEALAG